MQMKIHPFVILGDELDIIGVLAADDRLYGVARPAAADPGEEGRRARSALLLLRCPCLRRGGRPGVG